MTILDMVSSALLVVGALFFFAGTVGLLRFPDVYTRLHALTKADNLGLGCVVVGLALDASIAVALTLAIVWGLVLLASSVSCQLIARAAWLGDVEPWRRA